MSESATSGLPPCLVCLCNSSDFIFFQLTSLQVIWMSANSKCILTVSFDDCHPSDTVQVYSVYSWLNWLPVVLCKCCKPCVLWLLGDQSVPQFLGQSDGASEQLPCLRYSAYATYAHVISIHPKSEIFCGACFFGIENFFAAYLSIKVWNFRTPFVLILKHFVSMLEHAQPGNSEPYILKASSLSSQKPPINLHFPPKKLAENV